MAAAKPNPLDMNNPLKPNSKMHRRSRSGCFTCRLRRKKCDEGKPMCKACRHLGLQCEYKRPMWWSNTEQRRQQKEVVKNIIRHTKLNEKTEKMMSLGGADTPPTLSHSVPTSDTYSDILDRTRAASVESPHSLSFDVVDHIHPPMMHYPGYAAALPPPNLFSPYDVDVKTERQTFVNDVPTRRDSSMSTFSTFQPPPFATFAPSGLMDAWPVTEEPEQVTPAEWELPVTTDVGYFDVHPPPPPPTTTTRQAVMIDIDEADRPLLDHFLNHVLRLIFPVFELNQPGMARDGLVLPALETNRCYLHVALSVAARHWKSLECDPSRSEELHNDFSRHQVAAVREVCGALERDTDHAAPLEATLAMIMFQCAVGRPDDALPAIAWHQHFQVVSDLVHRLDLCAIVDPQHQQQQSGPDAPSFNMALTSWIDILGATMHGRSPVFAHHYREKHLVGTSSGLCELMGCDDRIMYLISEMACLEGLKREGMDDISLCEHVRGLGLRVGETEPGPGAVDYPYSATGALRPRQLARNMTAIFRFAARIYLCSLIPGYHPSQANIVDLLTNLAETLEFIPGGPDGYDQCLVWPYLIAGSAAVEGSSFRRIFQNRLDRLGDEQIMSGSFGRMVRLLEEVWHENELAGGQVHVHWRDVMQQRGWDDLLI
ncbi:MAG: hypothetical protein M1823_002781 [Watsoniomyces obsoletus]|nr:MAG: hypothetical protein M1823_002781 [Watsoniomyces obsoletus]